MVKRFLARRLVPTVLWVFRLLTPTRGQVVLFGFPPTEGNIIETARGLLARYSGQVVWLDPPSGEYIRSVGLSADRIRSVPRLSMRGFLSYILAEAVFFTHGIYGIPRAVPRKPTFNVWHGEGIKRSEVPFPGRDVGGKPADHLVACTERYGLYLAEMMGLDEDQVIMSGYPRNDALFNPSTDSQLACLGIDPAAPFVVWMPSFRHSTPGGVDDGYEDTKDMLKDVALASRMAVGAQVLRDHDIQLVIRSHPADSVPREIDYSVRLGDVELKRCGVTLYSVLGRSSGLITDVSSVATDYLLLDRPIGYFFPDKEDYLAGRGVWTEEVLDHLPGPLIGTEEEFLAWSHEVLGLAARNAPQRADARTWLGLVQTRDATDRMLSLIKERGQSSFACSLREID